MQDTLGWNNWYTFLSKKVPFGKYRMLPKFSRLGAGSVENYVDELIQFFLNSFMDFINSIISYLENQMVKLKKSTLKSDFTPNF